ncbi:MAG: c-type cytochrome [Gammaproteobacteria bacterium]|nr:c-type cytochrome [Gammaproteobacteria bacterium]
MSMHKLVLVASMACCSTTAMGDDGPRLGRSIDDATVAAIDFVVLPNGEGLPAGSGDSVQGEKIYVKECVSCHGASGQGGIGDALVGGQGTLASDSPVRTVGSYWPYATTLFDYIRRAMPYSKPGSLTDSDVYALTAYILFLNGIVAEKDVMMADTLAKVHMPNQDNFVWAYRPK